MRVRVGIAVMIWSGCLAAAEPHGSRNQTITLSVEQAQALVQTKGFLELPAVVAIDLPAATILGQKKGGLALPALNTLPPDVARALAQTRGLSLPGLKEISPEAASALYGIGGGWLALDGLTTINFLIARELARNEGELQLDGLTTISPDVADNLARHIGVLSLKGLTTLSAESARALGKHTGQLNLAGLTSLSKEAAAGLAAHTDGPRMTKRGLWLNGVSELSPDTAMALASHTGILGMYGLKNLPPDTARALMQHRGKLDLWKLPPLDPTTLKILASRRTDIVLPQAVVDQLSTLNPRASSETQPAKADKGRPVAVTEEILDDLLSQHDDTLYLSELRALESKVFTPAEGIPSIKHNNRLSPHALWAHPDETKSSVYSFLVPQHAKSLQGLAVVNQGNFRSQSRLTFTIRDGNQNLLWSTGNHPLQSGGEGAFFSVPVQPGDTIHLRVDAPNGIGASHAAWFEPYLTVDYDTFFADPGLLLAKTSQGLLVKEVLTSDSLGYALGLREGDEIYMLDDRTRPKEEDLRAAFQDFSRETKPFNLTWRRGWRRTDPAGTKRTFTFSVTAETVKKLVAKHRTEKELSEASSREKLVCSDGRQLTRAEIKEHNRRWFESSARLLLESDGDQEFVQQLEQLQRVLPALAEAFRVGNDSAAIDLINQVIRLRMGGQIGQVIRRVNADGVLYDIGDGKAATGEEVWELAIMRWAKATSQPTP